MFGICRWDVADAGAPICPRLLDFAIGSWQFNNIVAWQSGPVFNVTCDGGRVDLIGDPTPTQAQEAQGLELNRAAFRCRARALEICPS